MLITALQCITQTADGNAGFVRSTIVEAVCEVLNEAPAWRDAGEALLRTMDKFKFGDVWDQIAAGRDQIFPSTAKKDNGRYHSQIPDNEAWSKPWERSRLIPAWRGASKRLASIAARVTIGIQ